MNPIGPGYGLRVTRNADGNTIIIAPSRRNALAAGRLADAEQSLNQIEQQRKELPDTDRVRYVDDALKTRETRVMRSSLLMIKGNHEAARRAAAGVLADIANLQAQAGDMLVTETRLAAAYLVCETEKTLQGSLGYSDLDDFVGEEQARQHIELAASRLALEICLYNGNDNNTWSKALQELGASGSSLPSLSPHTQLAASMRKGAAAPAP